jgi:50S ribosomal protein L16 3-hydroxylase
MTYSIGFRAPGRGELAAELLQRLAEFSDDGEERAPQAAAVAPRRPTCTAIPARKRPPTPAALPADLAAFASQAVQDALKDPLALACALGEYMTEPKPSVWFDEAAQEWDDHAARAGRAGVQLDARTRMMYDADHVFINGESYRAKGADAT